jgi:hypothetical protein
MPAIRPQTLSRSVQPTINLLVMSGGLLVVSGGIGAAAASVPERAACEGFLQKYGGFIFKKVEALAESEIAPSSPHLFAFSLFGM